MRNVPADPKLRFAVVFNIAAGASGQRGPEEIANEITSAFERRSMSADLIVVKGVGVAEAANTAVLDARNGLVDGVAVGGGDGTVSTVAAVLAGTGIPLGVIPLGTLNHFAKDLAIPIDIDGAVGVIAAGRVREVDVGELNGKVFVNNSSIGIYPYMVSDRDRQEKMNGSARWSAMVLAAFRMLRRFPLRRLTISAEGRTVTCRVPCVFVGNNVYRFGLSTFGTRERLDAGRLCLLIARTRSRISFLRLAMWSAIGLLDGARDFDDVSVRSVRIEARTRRLPVACDGEVESMVPPLQYAIRPAALKVFVPV